KRKLREDLLDKIQLLKWFCKHQNEFSKITICLEDLQKNFFDALRSAFNYERRLHSFDVKYYNLFEDLYLSYYDDYENARIKCDLLVDEHGDLENKLELLLSIEEIEKSTEVQKKLILNGKNIQTLKQQINSLGILLKSMENDNEAERIRLKIPGFALF
ncbi:hypothetical protein MHBO_004957, partial [Bonamia ostreae]